MITTKEAIDALKKRISPYTNCAADAEANEVIEKAIKALKQGNVLDKIRADVINIADGRRSIPVRSVIKIIDKHKAESEGKNADSN